MCFGSRPQPPQIVYQGPSQEQIAQNAAALDTYRGQMTQQQQLFQQQLQDQINAANRQTADLQQRYDSEAAAAAATAAAQQVGAYAATTQSEAPVSAATTAATAKKDKPRGMRLSTASTASSPGSGLNIGV
jgi:hypothetical protein